MSTEMKTSDINEVEQFVRQHALLKDQQISIRMKNDMYIVELFSANEPST